MYNMYALKQRWIRTPTLYTKNVLWEIFGYFTKYVLG